MTASPDPSPSRPIREAFPTPPGAVRHSILRMVLTATVLVVVYAMVPVAGKSGVGAALLMVAGLAIVVALVVRQMKKIIEADHPKLRALEALALVVPVLLLVFAYTYLSLSHSRPESFTEPLSRIDAIYFATTIFGTVGFGDIAAKTGGARLIVTVQILIGLGAAVGLARLLLGAADLGLSRRPAPGAEASTAESSDAAR